jgi:Mg-chelatase subunit ChlI
VPVKEEIRRNAVARIAAGEPLFEGVLGYEHTVMPQLENALLAGHDVIFLGERGQAKTRMIRSLTGLLDEWMPIVAGSEINDDPYHPVSRTPATWSPSWATTRRSAGCTATTASARSWPRPTPRSPT